MMKRRESAPEMTPMVDVTFLLLIFFMVTASFSLQKSLPMPNPLSEEPSLNASQDVTQTDPIRLHVDRHGTFLLMAPDWQRELVGKKRLFAELAAVRSTVSAETDLRIEVESEARLQLLVDAIDAATDAGFQRYQFVEIETEVI